MKNYRVIRSDRDNRITIIVKRHQNCLISIRDNRDLMRSNPLFNDIDELVEGKGVFESTETLNRNDFWYSECVLDDNFL